MESEQVSLTALEVVVYEIYYTMGWDGVVWRENLDIMEQHWQNITITINAKVIPIGL